ncbi:MAG: aldolase/citrate lyase family protein, partial [Acidiferrobacterales bacterium]|nr:aldolase/citrate lyase family protein [Acidiferrobacterales bacterium]
MEMIENRLKQALNNRQVQVGCWLSLGSHTAAEICASAGFDWVLIDMEHAPNDVPQVLHLLHAAAA